MQSEACALKTIVQQPLQKYHGESRNKMANYAQDWTASPCKCRVWSSVQSLSCIRLCSSMDCKTPGLPSITNSQSLLKLMSIELVMPSNYLNLCRPLLLPPSIFPSIRVFSNESVLRLKWSKYWSFSFSISPSNEYSGLISFRIGWLDLLAVQGTLKSLLQHSVQKHQFFGAQLSL